MRKCAGATESDIHEMREYERDIDKWECERDAKIYVNVRVRERCKDIRKSAGATEIDVILCTSDRVRERQRSEMEVWECDQDGCISME